MARSERVWLATVMVFVVSQLTSCSNPSLAAEYVVKVDSMTLGRVTTYVGRNGWISVSEIEYGDKYVVETRTVYGRDGLFTYYEASFKTGGELVAKIVGQKRLRRVFFTLYTYADPKKPSSKVFSFDNPDLVILDNNFIIPHFEMMLKFAKPAFQIMIPQALFDPSKTDKASGVANLKRDQQGRFVLTYENVEIRITTDEHGILRMEYSNGVVVERTRR